MGTATCQEVFSFQRNSFGYNGIFCDKDVAPLIVETKCMII